MGTNLAQMIERFSRGIEFTVNRDPYELDYGVAQIPFGRVSLFLFGFLLCATGYDRTFSLFPYHR